MKSRHFFVSPAVIHGNHALLEGDDYHHAVRVLRLQQGANVELVDGSGTRYSGIIVAIDRRHVRIEISERAKLPPPQKPRIVLLQGIARGQRIEWVLQKCTELGVDEFIPVVCQRSVIRGETSAQKKARWSEIVRGATRQSQRAQLPAIHPSCTFAEAIASAPADAVKLVPALSAQQDLAAIEPTLRAVPPELWLLIGPEGGLTDEEVDKAQHHGFIAIGLGPLVLRTETAAIATTAILAYLSGRMNGTSEAFGASEITE